MKKLSNLCKKGDGFVRRRVNALRDKKKFRLTAKRSRDVNLKPISFRGGIRF